MDIHKDLQLAHSEAKSVWESYDDEEYRRDQSHWRGYGRWHDDAAWQRIGLSTQKFVSELVSLNGGKLIEDNSIVFLEWGPGGGSNLFSLRKHSKNYFGVDISQKNLDEAKRMIEAEGYSDIFVPVLAENSPSEVSALLENGIDIFISTSVFQHFPSKSYGAEVLSVVAKALRPGGLGVVQIRYDNGNPNFKPIQTLSLYKERHITANSYALDEFWNLLKSFKLTPLSILNIKSQNNSATYFFKKP